MHALDIFFKSTLCLFKLASFTGSLSLIPVFRYCIQFQVNAVISVYTIAERDLDCKLCHLKYKYLSMLCSFIKQSSITLMYFLFFWQLEFNLENLENTEKESLKGIKSLIVSLSVNKHLAILFHYFIYQPHSYCYER